MSIFFLSIRSEFAEMIVSGVKRWEFRQNPRFGVDLKIGDCLFVVSTSAKGGAVTWLCRIERIFRGPQVDEWLGASGNCLGKSNLTYFDLLVKEKEFLMRILLLLCWSMGVWK